ncbi:MAG: hypothetical protein ABEJ42_05975 [Halobacteriaceae archaeon]
MSHEGAPPVEHGRALFRDALAEAGHDPDRFEVRVEQGAMPDADRYDFPEQGFVLRREGEVLTVTAPEGRGVVYGFSELAERVRHGDEELLAGTGTFEFADAPAMEYRGYCLGLQKPTGYYDDHQSYDWPVTPEHFGWFYDRSFMERVLDRLARHKGNVLYLWSGHPFASFVDLREKYPEMPEVADEQLAENVAQYRWLTEEAEKRGIWIVQQFYNIHMSDPLAKERGWEIQSGVAHDEVAEYTRDVIEEFVATYPSVGLMPTMAEVLREEDSPYWLNEVIVPAAVDGFERTDEAAYPPLIVRKHGTELQEYVDDAIEAYPGRVSSIMKHNNEDYVSTQPEPGNTTLARQTGSHVVNVHTVSNLEPFAWGSPRFVRRTARNMVNGLATGVHAYPLRYWDCPNSARVDPTGDQLYEHYLWWSGWSRYGWEPERDEDAEDAFWERELADQYDLSGEQAAALLEAKQESGPVLMQTAGTFTITSGNRQANPLGLHLVPLLFANREFLPGRTYGMPQAYGFPLLNETLWTQSPVSRMERMVEKAERALDTLESVEGVDATPVLAAERDELEAQRLIARFYAQKARAGVQFMQDYFGVDFADHDAALEDLAASVETYRDLADLTADLFRDAASLHHHRTIPAPVDDGYLHWTDTLEVFEAELETVENEGFEALFDSYVQGATESPDYAEYFFDDEV